MKKKILLILGHPDKETFNGALLNSYQEGAKKSGAKTKTLFLGDLKFDPILHQGYKIIQELEPDLILAQEKIKWADHLVFFFPGWWDSVPALLKGFIDRAILPGFAFKYKKDSPWWDKYWVKKSARLVVTLDAPKIYYRLVFKAAGLNMMKYGVLKFCGVKPVKSTIIAPVRFSNERKRKQWLRELNDLGMKEVK